MTYDSFASVEVLQEGAKAIGWEKRNTSCRQCPRPVQKRNRRLGMSQHHAGHMGYHEGEIYFEKQLQDRAWRTNRKCLAPSLKSLRTGTITMKNALPDSGTNHDTALATLVAEMLGFTSGTAYAWFGATRSCASERSVACGSNRSLCRVPRYVVRRTSCARIFLSRAADCFERRCDEASDKGRSHFRDGGSEEADNVRGTRAVEQRSHPEQGRGISRAQGRAMTKASARASLKSRSIRGRATGNSCGPCTAHDAGLVINPLCSEADMHGSLVECTQMTTDPIPWDREFPGRAITASVICPIGCRRSWMFRNRPRSSSIAWNPGGSYGIKSFSETSIGAVRARSRMRSTTHVASAFANIRSREKKSWPA